VDRGSCSVCSESLSTFPYTEPIATYIISIMQTMSFTKRIVAVSAASLLVFSSFQCISAFSTHLVRHRLLSPAFLPAESCWPLQMAGDFPEQEEIYQGAVDWDEEWKKVVRGQGQPKERPSGNPKSDLEKVAVKAQREAEATIFKVKSQAKKAVNFRSLQSDWKVRTNLFIRLFH
jgi:hypothetical protein